MKQAQNQQADGKFKSDHESRVLAAAAAIFLEKGYEETSTADIARKAKVSKRELYANFADKRDILAAVITQLQSEMQSQADITWSSTNDLRAVLVDLGTQLLEFVRSEKFGKLFRIVAAESFRDPVSARKFYLLGPGRGREQTAAFMQRHIKAGNLRKGDPLEAADDFLDLVISSRQLTAIALGQQHDGRPTRAHVHHAVEVFLRYHGTGEVRRQGKRTPTGTARSAVLRQSHVLARSAK